MKAEPAHPEPRIPFLPPTRLGRIGAILAAVALAIFGAGVALQVQDHAAAFNPLAFSWFLILASGAVELIAIVRRGERSILGFVALVPSALLLLLFAMELVGLME